MKNKLIRFVEPSLPTFEDYAPLLADVWTSGHLSNMGPYHSAFEKDLSEKLGVSNISLVANGTLALILAVKALDLDGEVITTPFSFAATSLAIGWNNLTPVYVDIDPVTLNLDPESVEAAITDKTSAIVAVHVFGNPCDVEGLEKIAGKYNLSLIYDGAHAFGVNCHCGSILNHGDVSVLSFHATKMFNTFEGGAVVAKSVDLKAKIDSLKNFGFKQGSDVSCVASGLNAKMNEFSASLGVLQLRLHEENIRKRKSVDQLYRIKLQSLKGIILHENFANEPNYGYFPIFIKDSFPYSRDQLQEILQSRNIITKAYFSSLLNDGGVDEYSGLTTSIARQAANQILCLPIHSNLSTEEIDYICDCIIQCSRD